MSTNNWPLVLHLRAAALDPFTWPRYLAGSTWTRPIDLLTWSRDLVRDAGGPLQTVTSDPVEVAIGLLMVVLAELRDATARPTPEGNDRGATGSPERPGTLPLQTARVAEAIVRAAMVACEARPRWASAIVTGRRTMAEFLLLVGRRLLGSPILLGLGPGWVHRHRHQKINDFFTPGAYVRATLSMFEAGMVAETPWRGVSRFAFPPRRVPGSPVRWRGSWERYVFPDPGRQATLTETEVRWWAPGDRFTFPVKDTVDRALTLAPDVGRCVISQLRKKKLTALTLGEVAVSDSRVVWLLRRAVAAASGYTGRHRHLASHRVRTAFNTLMATWLRHMSSVGVRMYQSMYFPKNVIEIRQSVTREDIASDPAQALATIRAVRIDVARRVQAARDYASEVGAAYREWIDAHEEWLVVTGRAVRPRDGA